MRATTFGLTLRALACALMAWLVWLCFHLSTRDAVDVDWTCDATGCSSNDFASVAPVLGVLTGVALAVMASRFLHRAAPGSAVAFSALAAASGWHAALDAGRVAEGTYTDWHLLVPVARLSVSTWLTVLAAVAGAGALGAAWGAAVSLRRTAMLARLRAGRATAEAELQGWRSTGRRRGAVTVVFRDARGVRHEVPTVTERLALGRPVLAVYDEARPGDPATTRVAIPRKRLAPAGRFA
ncbi:hypothetical protein [Streptomyces sp. NPDC048172]|uniref:hypothetical protein n=1 Tax=Streptomyces sp. NPDC048172 TaxID=3365505 RepID=UPI00371BE137